MTLLECNGCETRDQKPMSCGHRHCNRCQNTDTSEWLQRQKQKHDHILISPGTFIM
ncbi:transposase zinc-binding domain-containing protein [Endozoicomonas sp. YOMI1]|uniref:transposase zinc-binding domain-containing protein n=1 Tax=Endozoicomonas sp. YOMI1 TaxID=2828739 RepID=UPI0035A0BEA9